MPSRVLMLINQSETEGLTSLLGASGNEVIATHSPQHLFGLSKTKGCDVALIDVNFLREESDAARILKNIAPDAAIIIVGESTQTNSLFKTCIKCGFHFLPSRFSCEHALIVIDRAKEITRLKSEKRLLESQWEEDEGLDDFVSRSPRMIEVLRQAATAAETLDPVLIYGPPGSEKQIVAFYIHRCSYRAERLFVRYRCGRLSESSEITDLFGGEHTTTIGLTQLATGGTLLLDNVCKLKPASQARLLRLIQDRCAVSTFPDTPEDNVRIICTSSGNLEEQMRKSAFRPDLFYRLNSLAITIPPLNQRPEDILPLAECFVRRFACEAGKDVHGIQEKAAELLQAYDWPGNVDELRDLIRSAVTTTNHAKLMPEDLFHGPARRPQTGRYARRKLAIGGGK